MTTSLVQEIAGGARAQPASVTIDGNEKLDAGRIAISVFGDRSGYGLRRSRTGPGTAPSTAKIITAIGQSWCEVGSILLVFIKRLTETGHLCGWHLLEEVQERCRCVGAAG